MAIEQRFAIGTKYKTRGKAPRICTEVDVLRTYNSAGELVKLRYVSQHEFLGAGCYGLGRCRRNNRNW